MAFADYFDVDHGQTMKRTLLLVLAALFAGGVSFVIQHSASRPIELQASVHSFQKVTATFKILDQPISVGQLDDYSTNIKILSADLQGGEVSLAANGKLGGDKTLLQITRGSTYRCLLSLSPTPEGERPGFRARCVTSPKLIAEPPAAAAIIQNVRAAFMKSLTGLNSDASGLVAGLAIGEVSRISPELIQDMKLVSLTHLTAVSGANCAIVLAVFYFAVRRLGGGRWARLSVGLIALVAYVMLVGAQPSVLRAAVMSGAVLVGISIGRKSSALSALALSVLVLLIADPWLALDFGFALSVLATSGLLVLTQPLTQKLESRFPKWLALTLSVSIAAQVFCLPVLLQLQSGLATYALPANILAEPLVAPITVLGILACAVAWFFPQLASLLTWFASIAAWLIVEIAHYLADLKNSTLAWPTGLAGALAATCVILGFVLWLKAEPTNLRNLGISVLSIIFAASLGSVGFKLVRGAQWPMVDWSVVSCDVGQGDSTVVRSSGMVALIDVGREDRKIDRCLLDLGVNRIDLLVLTHFDMDHIGGLRGALRGREVGVALVSPFKDERWGATDTFELLGRAKVSVLPVERGMSGSLGTISWQVLGPNRNAAEAEDSNDASVVMLWKALEFNLLTMADVGEKGQMRLARDKAWWGDPDLDAVPLILKVSHHGSADQFGELIEEIDPDLSLISAGKNNSYGHPTQRTLTLLQSTGSAIYRTDQIGAIAVATDGGTLKVANAPG